MEEKDEQIKMLLNEIKGIRSRLQNLITFEGRINDFEEFLAIINKIKDYIYKSNDKEIQQCYEQLNILVENTVQYSSDRYLENDTVKLVGEHQVNDMIEKSIERALEKRTYNNLH